MISNFFRTSKTNVRHFSTTKINFKQFKVAIIGAASGTAQNLALLLKSNPLIYKLSLYDVADVVKGVGLDLSHVATPSISKGYRKESLVESLECCDIVILSQGAKRKPNMGREDHWRYNSTVTSEIARAVAKICPNCLISIISNPVNSLVPLVSEIFRQECVYNPNHIFGISNISKSRAIVCAAELLKVSPECVDVPLIGGHSTASIIPVFSQCQPPLKLADNEMKALYQKIQLISEAVVRAKNQTASTLATAYCTAEFINAQLRALNCEPNIKETAYVLCDALGTKYCNSEFTLGGDGISKLLPQPKLNAYEQELLKLGVADLKKNVLRGEKFAANVNPYTKK